MDRQSLSALTRGIHHAATSTYAVLAQQYMQMIMQFFDEENGRLVAKMTHMQIDDTHWIPVPLISLVAPRGLALNKMKVAMSVRIEDSQLKQATIDDDNSQADRLSFKVVPSPPSKGGQQRQSNITDIEMEFTAGEPPEGVMRLIEQYTNLIDPQKEMKKIELKTMAHTPIKFSNTKLSIPPSSGDKES